MWRDLKLTPKWHRVCLILSDIHAQSVSAALVQLSQKVWFAYWIPKDAGWAHKTLLHSTASSYDAKKHEKMSGESPRASLWGRASIWLHPWVSVDQLCVGYNEGVARWTIKQYWFSRQCQWAHEEPRIRVEPHGGQSVQKRSYQVRVSKQTYGWRSPVKSQEMPKSIPQ